MEERIAYGEFASEKQQNFPRFGEIYASESAGEKVEGKLIKSSERL
jgi:hypothetical protein